MLLPSSHSPVDWEPPQNPGRFKLIAEGWQITPADLAVLSPYVTARIQRFGVYATDEIALTPEPFNAHLGIDLAAAS